MRVCVCGMMFYVTLSLHTYVYILSYLLSKPHIPIRQRLRYFAPDRPTSWINQSHIHEALKCCYLRSAVGGT